jgi:anti-sigma regulatory factor (Ser/Thr protein kinase)
MSFSLQLTLANDLSEIPRLAEAIETFCEPFDPSVKDVLSLQLALEELVTNVINHGYADGHPHDFTVTLCAASADCIRAVITDDAPAYDPLARPEVDTSLPLEERAIGGLGVHLVKKLMDVSHYERRDGKNILTVERRLNVPDRA